MKYKCLILDHDDTTVNSTAEVNYPALLDTLSHLRPDIHPEYEEFMDYCFEPGFFEYCTKILALDGEEMKYEYNNWKRFVREITPHACPGMTHIIERHRAEGGIVCVASHSETENILRDWKANFNCAPDEIYGWDAGADKRKPSPYAVFEIAKKYSLELSDFIVIDDLKHGYDMARNAGVTFAAALWAQPSRLCREFMENNADLCFYDTAALERYLFE